MRRPPRLLMTSARCSPPCRMACSGSATGRCCWLALWEPSGDQELVGLDREDCDFTREGLVLTLRRSKTDQEGKGRKVAIHNRAHAVTCAVRTLQEWLETAPINGGPSFRTVDRHGHVLARRLSPCAVALVVKRHAAVGLDAANYAGHSLRASLATSAAIAGASERSIMEQTGHNSVGMVRRYIRDGNLFRGNAAGTLGS